MRQFQFPARSRGCLSVRLSGGDLKHTAVRIIFAAWMEAGRCRRRGCACYQHGRSDMRAHPEECAGERAEIRRGSLVTLGWRGRPPHTILVPLRAFTFEPERSAVLTKVFRRSGINAFGQIQLFRVPLAAQPCKNPLRGEW